jgi:hypothetical protein
MAGIVAGSTAKSAGKNGLRGDPNLQLDIQIVRMSNVPREQVPLAL